MVHYERLLVLIDLWVAMRLRTRLVLAGICATGAVVELVRNDTDWISPLMLSAAVLAPLAFGAWRN